MPVWNEGGYSGWQIGSGCLTVGPHDQVSGTNPQPGRLIWNIESPDVKADFGRLRAAGATVIREPYRPDEKAVAWIAKIDRLSVHTSAADRTLGSPAKTVCSAASCSGSSRLGSNRRTS